MVEEFVRCNGLLELIKISRGGEINLVAVLISALPYRYNVSPLSVRSPFYECSSAKYDEKKIARDGKHGTTSMMK